MKPALFIFIFGVLSLSIQHNGLQIGKPLPANITFIDMSSSRSPQMVVTGPSSSVLVKKILYRGIEYSVSLDDKKKLTYVITFDKKFLTSEGWHDL